MTIGNGAGESRSWRDPAGLHQACRTCYPSRLTHGPLVGAVGLAGMPLEVDAWGIDICYSATQKCLSCPPGLAPLTVSPRAFEVIRRRKTPCRSWYFDLMLVSDYWTEGKRVYHHTAPISMLYGLREALRLVHEEGLPARFARHRANSLALAAGHGLTSIAFPAISTGIFGFPPARAAHIAVRAVHDALPDFPSIKRVMFCCFGKESVAHHEAALAKALGKGAPR